MICVVNWIPLRICVRSRNTQPHRKGGLEPSILDDLCLGNVISKYFSKLRFGTSSIQPELKCLENILFSFYEYLLRARLCEHELFGVRSIAFISTVAKSPDETWNKCKVLCAYSTTGCYTSGPVSTTNLRRLRSPVFESCRSTWKREISRIYYLS